MLAAISLLLALAFGAGPAFALDMFDVRQLRDSGYRWCRKCDLSAVQLQGANLHRAQLQGANLSHAGLQGADLSFAALEGAVLYEAQLTSALLNAAQLASADLRGAQLQDADLRYAQLQHASLHGALLQGAKLTEAQLTSARLGSARNAGLSSAYIDGALLQSAQLQAADLAGAWLEDADLVGVQLEDANLAGAQLKNAVLRGAQLKSADLGGAQLHNADLGGAQLQNADLRGAQLQNANLGEVNLEGAKLAHSDLTDALYEPVSAPPDSYVTRIRGLNAVRVNDVSGLVQLRELLQRAGHRDLEREATYSIERARTRAAFEARPGDPLRALEGALRFIAFELTTGYGLYPGRALLIMLGLMMLLSFAYLPWIGQQARIRQRRGAIYRIWPSERLVEDGQGVQLVTYGDVSKRQRAERLQAKTMRGRYGYGLWFSALSAFHIGWRELSVGTWLSRLQPREYALRAQGWPRFISWMQSLISVYLVAIWALTYFGRPFQ